MISSLAYDDVLCLHLLCQPSHHGHADGAILQAEKSKERVLGIQAMGMDLFLAVFALHPGQGADSAPLRLVLLRESI